MGLSDSGVITQKNRKCEMENLVQVLKMSISLKTHSHDDYTQIFVMARGLPHLCKVTRLFFTAQCSVDLLLKVRQAAVLTPSFLFLHRRRVLVVKT